MAFRRDPPTLSAALRNRLAGAIARTFDETVLFGPAPGTGFDTLASVPVVDLSAGFYDGLVQAIVDVSEANGDLSAWVFNGSGEGLALQALDGNGRPLFINNLQSEGRSIGSLLGRPAFKSRHVSDGAGTVGFAGDWTSA